MKKKPLEFVFKYEHWTEKQWGNVMFSDESTFQQFPVRRHHVRLQGKK